MACCISIREVRDRGDFVPATVARLHLADEPMETGVVDLEIRR